MEGDTFLFNNAVNDCVENIIKKSYTDDKIISTIMLTGGRSAKALYKYWAEVIPPYIYNNITYYFGDERCVLPEHPDSNYGMAVSSLFPNGISGNCKFVRMKGESSQRDVVASDYSNLLPESVDILLLSVGTDGHIASLFPDSNALNENERAVVSVNVPVSPIERLTITSKVIKSAKNIIVMATGIKKGEILARALQDPENISELPVRITIGSTWILDQAATKAFKSSNQHKLYNTRIIYA